MQLFIFVFDCATILTERTNAFIWGQIMKKNNLILFAVISVVSCAVFIALFDGIYRNVSDKTLPWWAYIVLLFICALIVYLVYLLLQIRQQSFDKMLVREGFHIDKRYEADGQTLCIDFEGKRIADTYLSTKPLIRFEDIVGYRVESYRTGRALVLSEDKRYLNIVLTVSREDATYEHPYFYIAMFEVQVDASDVGETPDVTGELVAKYPTLKPLFDLKQDVISIMQINKGQ